MVDIATKGAMLVFSIVTAIGCMWAMIRSMNIGEVENLAKPKRKFKKKESPGLFWGGILFFLLGFILMTILALTIIQS